MSAPDLIHVGTLTAKLGSDQFLIPNGPMGSRMVAEVDSVTLDGERVKAHMVGTSAADWVTIGPDRSYGTLDVRFTLKTDDDAYIYCEYSGKINMAAGRAISAPLFQCGDERYDWMNRSQFIGDGTVDPEASVITYQLYEVRPG